MRYAFKTPNSLFLLVGLGFVILKLIWPRAVVIIEIHDTMVVATISSYLLSMAVVFLFFWIAYSVGRASIYSTRLVWLHFFLCVNSALILTALIASEWTFTPRRYFVANEVRLICLTVFVFSQFVFLVNMIVGITRKLFHLGSSRK
jgi:hypothetical protein